MQSIIHAFNEGGSPMYVILAFAILTVVFVVERANALYFKLKQAAPHLRTSIHEHLLRGDFKAAETAANTVGANTALGRVAAVGCKIKASGGGDEEVQARMDEKLQNEISLIDRRTGFLAMFGNVATLMGLLGTIIGMIHSFGAVANASPVERAAMLSKGISEAMNCTAFGLVVAIPALVAYAIYQNRTDRFVSELTEATTEIYNDLIFVAEVEPTAPSHASSARGARVQNAPTVSM